MASIVVGADDAAAAKQQDKNVVYAHFLGNRGTSEIVAPRLPAHHAGGLGTLDGTIERAMREATGKNR